MFSSETPPTFSTGILTSSTWKKEGERTHDVGMDHGITCQERLVSL